MSYFGSDTLEEAIYSECEYNKSSSDLSNSEIVLALVKVLEVYAERTAEGW